ncbi:glycosyltransferase family 2 protein [Pleomorphomonas sp. NRK KF1]|uniref:glycosyltransferase family 2 protein n=1 Tax=Pleomorphomonas sp. NRK KF1 TaxID=2943000 RepID=UPI002044523A|nr:glycosyltransferase family 2 protein [Pleomorphomonas sp. NRK KF1]MCM5553605.1 glycosyltransferase family 2 protein [Pleomorphomonas sp. NRK KF1]
MNDRLVSPRLSIVVPCFNEQDGLDEFVRRMVLAATEAVGQDYEIIAVDDGSSDATWDLITAHSCDLPNLIGVRLMRNYGHQMAATAGLSVARGERVLLIDADLQDPPELLLLMTPIMDRGADVVYGQRSSRAGETRFKLVTAAAFYRLLGRLTSVPIPKDAGDFRLMSRRVVDILLAMPERDRFIRGMVSWVGGRQVALPYERDARFAGETKYPLRKMVRFALDAITSFSTVPLRIATWVGFLSAVIAVALVGYTLVQWFAGHTVAGWSSLMATVAGFFSIQFIGMGIMGEYLGRLVEEAKQRPMFAVDSVSRGGVSRPLELMTANMRPSERRAAVERAIGVEPDLHTHDDRTGTRD